MTDQERATASATAAGVDPALRSFEPPRKDARGPAPAKQAVRPRVLFLAPQPFFTNRGTPLRVLATARALVELGAEVDLLVYPHGESIELPGIRISRSTGIPGIRTIPIGFSIRKVLVDVPFFLSAWRLIRTGRYSAVHGVEEAGVMAALLSRRYRVPFIFDMHSHMSEQLTERTMRRGGVAHRLFASVENSCIRRAASVITVADCITERLEQFGREGVSVTLPDIPVEHTFPTRVSGTDALIRKLGVEGRSRYVYTGNFRSYQGLEILLDGFARLISSYDQAVAARTGAVAPRPVLLIVGGGPEEADDLARLTTRIAELGIAEDVRFLGQRHVSEMGTFMAIADVLVSSRSAGGHTPLKIYSYLAARKPIVATRVTAHTMVLNDEIAHMCDLTADSMGQALFGAIDPAGDAVERRRQMVERGAEVVERHFSWERFRERLGDAYCGIISNDSGSPRSSAAPHSSVRSQSARFILLPFLSFDLRVLLECMSSL